MGAWELAGKIVELVNMASGALTDEKLTKEIARIIRENTDITE
jgi:hypothetical protein